MVATIQFAIFSIDDRQYGLRLDQVERVVRAVDITPLPHVPTMVLGVIDVHGTPIPVLNIRHRLGKEPRPIGLDDQFVIVNISKRPIALVVDEVREVIACPIEAVVPAKKILPEWKEIQGIVQLEGGLILIQDLDRFLSLQEDIQLEQALRGQAEHGN